MVDKCKNCGNDIIRFPLKDREGKFIIKNFFKMSWDSIVLIIIIVAMVTAYKYDTGKCEEMIEDPLGYCEDTNACRILINKAVPSQFVDPAGVNIFDEDLIPE